MKRKFEQGDASLSRSLTLGSRHDLERAMSRNEENLIRGLLKQPSFFYQLKREVEEDLCSVYEWDKVDNFE